MSVPKKEAKRVLAEEAVNESARALAYILRGAKGPEARSARLSSPAGANRVDYFRGKDLYRVFHKMPEVLDEFAPKITGVPTAEDPTDADRVAQVTAIGQEMLRRGFFVRAERVYKEPRPGRSRRPRFPRFLQLVPRAAQQFTDDGEGFYSWTYEQPMTWTSVIVSFLVAFAVILMCLFPLSPVWFKKCILYLSMGFLIFLFLIFAVRAVVFTAVWVIFGRQFWILPNISSDEIPIDQIFSPLWCFDDVDREGKVVGRVPLHKRLFAAGGVGAVLAALYHIAPERGSAIKTIHKAHGSILDLFDLYDTPKGLAGGNATDANATDTNATHANATIEAAAEAASAGAEGAEGAEDAEGIGSDLGAEGTEDGEDVAPPAPPPPYAGDDGEPKTEL